MAPGAYHLVFKNFLLNKYFKNYQEYNSDYNYVFNSYYESVGARVIRTDRGNLSRPSVEDVYNYRKHVDMAMENFLSCETTGEVQKII